MEMILFAFFGFVFGIIVGAGVAGIVASSINDKILENNTELCDIVGEALTSAIDYGRKVKLLEEKLKKEYLDSCKGGVVSQNKQYEDFITRSETVVDINKLKDEFDKQQK